MYSKETGFLTLGYVTPRTDLEDITLSEKVKEG